MDWDLDSGLSIRNGGINWASENELRCWSRTLNADLKPMNYRLHMAYDAEIKDDITRTPQLSKAHLLYYIPGTFRGGTRDYSSGKTILLITK